MTKSTNFIFTIFVIILIVTSCDNSVKLKDGYTLYGNVTSASTGKGISSVNIYIGYSVTDTAYFSGYFITSDTLGKFVFTGSPGTAPGDEILRFKHPDYITKDIILKNSARRENYFFRLNVLLQPK